MVVTATFHTTILFVQEVFCVNSCGVSLCSN